MFDGIYNHDFPEFDQDLRWNDVLDTNDGLHPQVLGHSGDMDPYLLQNYQYGLSNIFQFKQLSVHSVSQSSVPTQFLLSQPDLFSSSRQEMGHGKISLKTSKEKLEDLVPRDTGVRLISLFRRFILPQYPIFSEPQFPDSQTSPPHLLAAIYTIAQPFAKFDDVLSIELAYENLNNEALFQIILEALRYEAHNPNIATAQTLLLVILRPSTNPLVLESSFRWSLMGTLVATSQTLGLHHDPTSWNISRSQIALRRRLSCTIFTTDKWLAASLGRPPLIMQDTWLVTSLSVADGHGSYLSSALWSTHLQYSKLGSLMGDVLNKLFSLRAMHELASNIEETTSTSRCLLKELSDWHQDFTSHSGQHPKEDTSLPIICTLGYHYSQMTIFRATIRPFLANVHENVTTPDITNPDQSNRAETLSFTRAGVHSSTAVATTFVKSLHQDHSHMFWPHWSQVAFSCICFLDLLMATSSLDTQEALAWFQELHAARREIRLKSAMLPVLRLGLLRIDAIFWKGIDKVLHLLPHVREALEVSLETDEAHIRP
ncbi:hypothetical protein DM02DRAFT_583579 [Periconia macrospinosa]|uniref:Xylanolytic transcriptional activator regulatory domain-containing protein n=1 Tax=Periconia macrospinosa TaxID=97972 RepID=A0A2V1E6K1_9PLEO|nr:hypothetical protein DM02DRAFT_583579 [Periconia macrospinosa]